MHVREVIRVLRRVLAPVEMREPVPGNSVPPLQRKEHPGVQIAKSGKNNV